MLISKTVKAKWSPTNRDHFEKLGYIYEWRGTLELPPEQLNDNSHVSVKWTCDYCGEEHESKWQDYKKKQNGTIKKDACKKCWYKKCSESNEINYGVTNQFEREEVKDKCRETTLENYGTEYYVQTEEYKTRVKETNLKKYGVENVAQNEEIKQKIIDVQIEKYGDLYTRTDEYKDKYKKTCQERYGVDNAFQIEEVKENIIKFNIKKYGVTHPMKIRSIAMNATIKGNITRNKLGKGQSSTQQDYVYNLIHGELNYPVGKCMLDIAFPEEKIYVECDFSGHDLSVKMGYKTQKQFEDKEIKRNYYLDNRGWKRIRIISINDILPLDEVLLDVINKSKAYLQNHHWTNVNIDSSKIINSQGEFDYDFGKLLKIKKGCIKEVS